MRTCYLTQFKNLTSYKYGLELQHKAFEFVVQNNIDGILLLLQHKPVITIGKSGGMDNLLVSKETLNRFGIELYKCSRGGNITYHGPGQLVVYPILNLNKFQKDAHWYLRQLETVVMNTVRSYGVKAGIKPKYTGVWVGNQKIAAIGVGIRKWITKHGFALNICVNKDHFKLITPCGISEFGICSLEDFVQNPSYDGIVSNIKRNFKEVFSTELIDKNTINDWKGSGHIEYKA
ncbi:lipoyl(octanoyl) transferase LipB [Clostridium tyrobutyricum]|uniref:lipoyl(octanoyl) transferase LipB n=1 Tax=Clostridium tyrobutyricum TaxID=1519 RepID=UPI0011C740C7|nr:lipoyl(octanoyl) transferase LipB [Clostridium tyrobutyricum]